MKKEFAFSVAIEQYTQETIDFCKELGYNCSHLTPYGVLVNNYLGENNFVSNVPFDEQLNYCRTLVNWETEKELCKALLAATKGDIVFKHEYIYSQIRGYKKVRDFVGRDISCTHYAKPSLGELLNHFRPKRLSDYPLTSKIAEDEFLKPFDYLTKKKDESEIVGWQPKQISGVTDAIIAICGLPDDWDGEFLTDTYVHKKLISLNVLESWCMPIYKEVETPKEKQLKEILTNFKANEIQLKEAINQINNL